jgi:hypothetical protein
LRYVAWGQKRFGRELKKVYDASTIDEDKAAIDTFEESWVQSILMP